VTLSLDLTIDFNDWINFFLDPSVRRFRIRLNCLRITPAWNSWIHWKSD